MKYYILIPSFLQAILSKKLMPACGSNKATLTHASLTAVILLSCRPLIYSDFSDAIAIKFVENVLTVPAVIHHARKMSPEVIFIIVFRTIYRLPVINISGWFSVFNAV